MIKLDKNVSTLRPLIAQLVDSQMSWCGVPLSNLNF